MATELFTIANGSKPLQYLPVGSLRKFGITPNGGNLYRIILSTSRLHMLGGTWPDGLTEYRWVPRYPMPMWCLEKWISAEDYAGPESDWHKDPATNLFTLGPYPKDGEYEFCFGWPFDMEPTYQQIEDVIGFLERRRQTHKMGDYLAEMEAENLRRQDQWLERNAYIMRDAIRTKAMRPTPSNPQGKTLTADDFSFNYFKKTANDVGLGKGGIVPKEKVQCP